jgi:hypothetical protein
VADDEIDVFKFGMKGASLRWFIKKSTPRAPYYYWQHYTAGGRKKRHSPRTLFIVPGTSEREMTFRSLGAGARNPSNFLFTEIKK